MMGEQKGERELFSYAINLEKRVRSDHPLRRVARLIDFKFVRAEAPHSYRKNGHVSVDPEVILKMMFLLFFDDVPNERELMKVIAERLDYLWFLGYGQEDEIPDHSVLSKARTRWGKEVFERRGGTGSVLNGAKIRRLWDVFSAGGCGGEGGRFGDAAG